MATQVSPTRGQHQALLRVHNGVAIRVQQRAASLDHDSVLAKLDKRKSLIKFLDGQVIYAQEDLADSVFYLRKGRIKLAVLSANGKEAVISILEIGAFFGQGSLIVGQPVHLATATSIGESIVGRFTRQEMRRLLRTDTKFGDTFVSYLVARIGRVEADLVDQIVNPLEKRLARILLLLANFRQEGEPQSVITKISQDTLAQMVGASRARVSTFLNKFRKLGLIDYSSGFLRAHRSLLNVLVNNQG